MFRAVRRNPGLTGWAGVLAVVVTADVAASRNGQPTMSALVARAQRHDIGGPVIVGLAVGLAWHLVVQPVIAATTREVMGGTTDR